MTMRERLNNIARERILILDGAMGSMIQGFHLSEADFRGSRFASHERELAGCNDLLCLTKPKLIAGIHEAYLRAGADIIETCSFNSTAVSLADYGIGELAYEVSAAAAGIAREAADRYTTAEKPRFVAGSMGPTAKSAGMSPDIEDPGKRSVTWDELEAAYYENARGLLDGGADILLIETVFDTLNAKAAISAISRLLSERGGVRGTAGVTALRDFPLAISATVSDTAGRLLTGQTVEAFLVSVLHADPWSIGLNCSFGAAQLKKPLRDLALLAPCLVSAHPNAGLPNQLGAYDETPESMAAQTAAYLQEGLVNILGGCCGSTPAHIAAIAAKAEAAAPRIPPLPRPGTWLAGLESLRVNREQGLTIIGERAHAPGSRKFLGLIRENKYDETLGMVREMIAQGAAVINVCMDDPFLDAAAAMTRFLNLALADPDIARLPFMIDSSRWEVLEAGLKCLQGKGIVNSISLKEGEEEFLKKAFLARTYGAAVVVMLFDEQGQAASYERKIEIAARAYALLTGRGFPPEDIIFDPNVFALATGISEHEKYALDFIRACEWIKTRYPAVQISAGVSNLSFSFRGNERIREAMHAVFLKYAGEAGLSMAIVKAGLPSVDRLDPPLRQAAEEVILCSLPPDKGGPSASAERLLAMAMETAEKSGKTAAIKAGPKPRSSLSPEDRILEAMITGRDDYIEEDLRALRAASSRSLEIVEGPLMRAMGEVGNRFGEGRLFLPQVIRSARVMKKAVSILEPFIEAEKTAASGKDRGRILLATVKGDVHDIGKNIVGVVLGCNGYEILDLGVMVPPERIIKTAEQEGVDLIGLSGLITPSLDEMVKVAREMEKNRLTIPLLIGGAAASLAHTGLKIVPEYSGPVVYVPDASRSVGAVRALLSETYRSRFLEELEGNYREAVKRHQAIQARIELLPLERARQNKIPPDTGPSPQPRLRGIHTFNDYPLDRVIPYINWKDFLHTWDMRASPQTEAGVSAQGEAASTWVETLLEDGKKLLDRIASRKLLRLRGVLGFFPALSRGEDLFLYDPGGPARNSGPEAAIAQFSFLRSQERKRAGRPNPCLADFIPSKVPGSGAGWIGLFALSAGFGLPEAEAAYKTDDYGRLLLSSLANALAEAFIEELHLRVRRELWGYAPEENLSPEEIFRGAYQGIRPAFGYPACPDHQDKRISFDLLGAREKCGLELTDTAMIVPAASVCGMFFSSPRSYYFGLGTIGEDQLADWAARKGLTVQEARRRIGGL
ncbi:MAG: methionine synthase [Spirochaetaceae bacterium]|jgi:5-methyltetrahydrofolate--homocysteine methyltransferase|nr:methionine synthase [Spirochaetaceae bacterium]